MAGFVARHSVALTLTGALIFLSAGFAAMQWQPISTDEGDFMLAAMDWSRWRTLIPHPQGYVHALQAMFLLFGETVPAARLVSLGANLATTALLVPLVFFAFRRQLDPAALRRAQIFSVILWASSPLVVQNLVLIDIDNSLLTTAVVLTLLAWYGLAAAAPPVRILVTGLAFGVALWTKLPTPPLLLAAMVTFHLLRREWRTAGGAALAGVAGALLFVATHLVYSAATGYTLRDAAASLVGRGGNFAGLIASMPSIAAQSTGVVALWISIPFLLLALVGVWRMVRRLFTGTLQDGDLLFLFVGAIALFYGTMIVPAWGYPRYHTPGLAALCAALGGMLADAWQPVTRRALAAWALGILAAMLLHVALVGDPLYAVYRATFESVAIADRMRTAAVAVGSQLGIMVVVLSGMWLMLRRTNLPGRAVAVVGLFALVLGFALATNVVQVRADYSTRYRYTYRYADRQAAIDYVRTAVPAHGIILADKDILWYVDRAGEQVYPYLQPQALRARLAERRVDALAWTEKEWLKSALRNDPESVALLARCFATRQFGIFFVAVRTPECTELP